ncbi:MAG: hypothetical protein KKF30_10440 [Proteobacteria bacterium]|nr:hypothetical protein [Pseudomonadota bacterium]MBU4470311.1 hypothetical protein [Pseudomonadota bacterium]MCG2752723.1 hypothetical protein [Desulfobacteraceae bacterium]
MGTTDENALWFKGKRPVIAEYEQGREAVLSTIASQAFCRMPGFVKKVLTSLEIGTKEKLSALNYDILQSAIERELRQAGIAYDLSYRQAALNWEIERQGLLDALDREFAGMKRSQAFTEEALSRMDIEIGLRALVVEAAKLAFSQTEEEYKRRVLDSDSTVNTAETSLINEKLFTAQKRLALITYLEEILEAERRLLIAETANIVLETDLVEAKGELIAKEATKIPAMIELATQKTSLAQSITARIEHERQILLLALARVFLDRDKTDADISIMAAETALDTFRRTLNDEKVSLSILKSNNMIAIERQENRNKTQIMMDMVNSQTTTMNADGAAVDQVLSINVQENNIAHQSERESSTRMTEENRKSIVYQTADTIREIEDSAEISANQKITAQLTHLFLAE